jgi:hypothetical protein
MMSILISVKTTYTFYLSVLHTVWMQKYNRISQLQALNRQWPWRAGWLSLPSSSTSFTTSTYPESFAVTPSIFTGLAYGQKIHTIPISLRNHQRVILRCPTPPTVMGPHEWTPLSRYCALEITYIGVDGSFSINEFPNQSRLDHSTFLKIWRPSKFKRFDWKTPTMVHRWR